MKSSGIVRRMDDLGRVVIPKGVREKCGIKEGAALEICYDEKAQTVTLKCYKTEKELRDEWVNKWYDGYSNALCTITKRVGNMTIVAWNGRIETARCRRGDTYDPRVGEAICMAKLCGERIPEYI